MSRAYRIQISESLHRIIKADDRVSTHLEILNVLPQDEMGKLLAQNLLARGFEEKEGKLVREEGGMAVIVDPLEGTVTVTISECEEVDLEAEEVGWAADEDGKYAKQTKEALQKNLQDRLKREADAKEAELQSELTDKLESHLRDLRQELNEVANQVTADALKRKASQMGKIKEVAEDSETGSMTIVLEV